MAAALSVDTLSNIALANDLLESIISELNLGNPTSGQVIQVETLAQMMQVHVEVANVDASGWVLGFREKGDHTVLPLLVMTVKWNDPLLLKQIADTWADQFIQQNVLLFASESVRSFDFIQSQYDETWNALRSKN